MRTTRFRTVLQGVAHLMGVDLTALTAAEAQRLTECINQRVREGWEWDFWPEWTLVEQRPWRDAWAAGTTYAAGDEIWFAADETYYAANSAPNTPAAGESPGTDADKWTEVESGDLVRYLAPDQAEQTPIGEVRGIFTCDPRTSGRRHQLPFTVTARGFEVRCTSLAQVWVEFRLRPPEFTSESYDAERAYVADEICYNDDAESGDGECYRALQATTGHAPSSATYWERIELPAVLATFVKRAAYADALRFDGQAEKAAAEEQRAYGFLGQANDNQFAAQGQYDSAQAQTY